MNKTTATILTASIVLGGVVISMSGNVSAETTVERVSTSTIKVLVPQEMSIKKLKDEIKQLRETKQALVARCDVSVANYQKQIDELKVLIDKAAVVGVE